MVHRNVTLKCEHTNRWTLYSIVDDDFTDDVHLISKVVEVYLPPAWVITGRAPHCVSTPFGYLVGMTYIAIDGMFWVIVILSFRPLVCKLLICHVTYT